MSPIPGEVDYDDISNHRLHIERNPEERYLRPLLHIFYRTRGTGSLLNFTECLLTAFDRRELVDAIYIQTSGRNL